jgi:hypothetical protein
MDITASTDGIQKPQFSMVLPYGAVHSLFCNACNVTNPFTSIPIFETFNTVLKTMYKCINSKKHHEGAYSIS